jgi:hypothetical protein
LRWAGGTNVHAGDKLSSSHKTFCGAYTPPNAKPLVGCWHFVLSVKLFYCQLSITCRQNQAKTEIAAVIPAGTTADNYIRQFAISLSTSWMPYFLRYDPAPALEKVQCPVLEINGDKDLQVPAKENLSAIEEALKKGGNLKVTTKTYPRLNHLFQECNTGSPAEYGQIEQTISPDVLKDLSDWILTINH